ncbi:MAG: hypothetical protein AAF962_03080 [Actinomycetota bacterium]
MMPTAPPGSTTGRTGADAHLPSLFRVPGALWLYGAVRALSFGAPLLTSAGGVGLGLAVAAALWVGVLQGRRLAWRLLLAVDVASVVLLTVAVFTVDGARPVAPALAAVAVGLLVTPSSRRHVAG